MVDVCIFLSRNDDPVSCQSPEPLHPPDKPGMGSASNSPGDGTDAKDLILQSGHPGQPRCACRQAAGGRWAAGCCLAGVAA